MELEIEVCVLEQAEEQLKSCRRITHNCAEEIAEVLASLEKDMDNDAGYELRRRIKKYQQSIADTHDKLQMLYVGIEQISRLYGQCEQEIMKSREGAGR